MIKIETAFFSLLCFAPLVTFSQAIDNTASFREMPGEQNIRFHYDNDFFTATDRYYSQGIGIELIHPGLVKNPLSRLLLFASKGRKIKYGASIEHSVFTPTSIRHEEIIYNDHPFASFILLKSFAVSTDTIRGNRVASAFSIGVIGPAAFGHEMQKTIHQSLGDIQPLGWQNQIRNDLILNYSLDIEKPLFVHQNFLSLNTDLKIKAGTLIDQAWAGLNIIVGKYRSPYFHYENNLTNRFQIYFYNQVLFGFSAFDATLEGGMLNHGSPYKINPNELTRILFQDNVGVVLILKKLCLEYYQSIHTKEFKTGLTHRWGGIKIGLTFREQIHLAECRIYASAFWFQSNSPGISIHYRFQMLNTGC